MSLFRTSLALLLALSACRKEEPVDLDGDGATADLDCDDLDGSAHPGAEETCDGVDNDCDGEVDNGAVDALTWYGDADGDGFGDAASAVDACVAPAGYVERAGDCDDAAGAVHPGAAEWDCTDPTDYNCDGSVGYADADADGVPACEECDDSRADVFPGADERCDQADNDCDGAVDEEAIDAPVWYADLDGDGHAGEVLTVIACEAPEGSLATADDCDDLDASAFPGGEEVCDGVDNDCDGAVDDDPVDATVWYLDGDADGYGDPDAALLACERPQGRVENDLDCDDAHAAARPGGTEVCDGLDNDCDGDADADAVDRQTWYPDGDGDGFGDGAAGVRTCSPAEGAILDGADCDDGEAARYPGNAEVCDALDNDCDGQVDDNPVDAAIFFTDGDDDGYGLDGSAFRACAAPAHSADRGGDCDDTSAARFPANPEVCDTLDNDCDGQVDEDATDADPWYRDLDRDGYGGDLVVEYACAAPAPTGWLATAEDCDDLDRAVSPAGVERCNGYDDDCDGSTDELGALGEPTWYGDGDGDGYGDPDTPAVQCDAPAGYVDNREDCDDALAMVHPYRLDLPGNGQDDDCDGVDAVAMVCSGDQDVACFDELTGEELLRIPLTRNVYGVAVSGDGRVWWSIPAGGVVSIYRAEVGDSAGVVIAEVPGYGQQLWWDEERQELLLPLYGEGAGGSLVAVDPVSGRSAVLLSDVGVATPRMAIRLHGTDDYLLSSSADSLVHYVDGVGPELIPSPEVRIIEPAGDGAAWVSGDGLLWRWERDAESLIAVDEGFFGVDADARGLCTPVTRPGALWVGDDLTGTLYAVQPDVMRWTWMRDGAEGWECDTNSLLDGDEDGVAAMAHGGADCDDTDPAVLPGATPVCDDRDHDCDGAVDFDADADGFSDAACGGSDPDDTDATVRPVSGSSCLDIVGTSADRGSGLYAIDPTGTGAAVEVWCDMETDGGGWTLLMRVSDFDAGIDFTEDGAGWTTTAPYHDVRGISLSNPADPVDFISPAFVQLGIDDVFVRESLLSYTHSVYTADAFMAGRSLHSVISQPIVKGSRACSSSMVYPDGYVDPWPGYDSFTVASDEAADTEPSRLSIRNGCAGDSEIVQVGYRRVDHGDQEVWSQSNQWGDLRSVYILGR
ncbi:MAG: hypothetical protein JXX28_17205 [Deltaproteobacteria bacterium]|nr:hypothetical protein [Deltaproteobacteria bacterium]